MNISLPAYNLGANVENSLSVSGSKLISAANSIKNQEEAPVFDNLIGRSMAMLNETQQASELATQGLIMGDSQNLHDVMIKATEAQLALDLAVQVRNKSLEAFNEIKNMQF